MSNYVIVRGDHSGVFFGELVSRNGQEIKLANCQKIWYWSGANAIEQIALEGVKNPKDTKITVKIDSMEILDCVQCIPCTEVAISNLKGISIWKR